VIKLAIKKEKKRKNDNKTTNPKTSNPIIFDIDHEMILPVKGLK